MIYMISSTESSIIFQSESVDRTGLRD